MLRFLRRDRQAEAEKTRKAVEKTRQTWFGRLRSLLSSPQLDDAVWDELEEVLISTDVGVDTSLALVEKLKQQANRGGLNGPEQVWQALRNELIAMLEGTPDAPAPASTAPSMTIRPTTILMVGVNGVGKTTSIAKLAQLYADEGKQVLLGAADTFRAAAIEQLQVWGTRVGADVIAHQQGADPGAVAFDTLHAARSRGVDVVIIDTAGRLHSKANLMEEMKKVRRVLSRHDDRASVEVILAMDATTGQNGLAQAKAFCEAIHCDGVFLSKLDGTAKGGVVIAIAAELELPVLYIGTGEQLEDITPFDPREFVDALFASPDAA
jgi:fused signal recognition particle receptor